MSNIKQIEIKGFNLPKLKTYIKQNLALDRKIIMNFSNEFIRSYALSASQTMMKLWMAPTKELINIPEPELFDDEKKEVKPIIEDTFTLFVMRGDSFIKYISIFAEEDVDIKFWISQNNNQYYVAHRIVISGKTKTGNYLSISIDTTDDENSNYQQDYEKLIGMITPPESYDSFTLSSDSVVEIQTTVKNLHKAIPDNTSYISFQYSKENEELTISDKVFKLSYFLGASEEENAHLPSNDMEFAILKSDFVNVGNQPITMYADSSNKYVIANTNFKHSIIGMCLSKVDTYDTLNNETTEFNPDQPGVEGFDDGSDIDDIFS